MAPSRISGDAGLRHDGGDPASCQSAHTKKNEAPACKKSSGLIRWSIQEIRQIANRLAQKRIRPAYVIAWSLWRRAHQAVAQQAHFKSKVQL
jgi:hypothetical protein